MKSFKIFDRVKKKESKRLEDTVEEFDIEKYIKSNREFTHIPAKAYEKIYDRPEYLFLRKGLDVMNERMDRSPDIQQIIEDVGIDDRWDEKKLSFFSWYESKTLTDETKGIMLTPAMYFLTINYLKTTVIHEKLLESMTEDGAEWLDAVIDEENEEIIIKPDIHKPFDNNDVERCDRISGGLRYKHELWHNGMGSNFFGFNFWDLDPITYFPKEKFADYRDANYVVTLPERAQKDIKGIRRANASSAGAFNQLTILANYDIDTADFYCGVRLCYEVRE